MNVFLRKNIYLTRFAGFALILGSIGCAGKSPESRITELGIETPAAWSATPIAKKGVDHRWIQHFKDPQLISLVQEAQKNNPNIRAIAARVEQSRSTVLSSGASRRLMLTLGSDASRSRTPLAGGNTSSSSNRSAPSEPSTPPPSGPAPSSQNNSESTPSTPSSITANQFSTSLRASWELDVWGRVRAGESAAVATYEAALQDEKAARSSLAAEVARAWYSLIEARAQHQLSLETLTNQQKTVDTIRERFEAGQFDQRGSSAELRLAMSDLAQTEARVSETRQEIDVAARQLETLLGRFPHAEIRSSSALPILQATPPPGLPSELLQRRPDILAAERHFASAGKRIKEAKLSLFPQIKLTGSLGTAGGDLKNILNSQFGVWSLAGGLTQNILTGGQVRAEIIRRSAVEQEALANLQQVVLNAFREVENSLSFESSLRIQESAIRRATELAKEARVQAQEEYAAGTGDLLTVLTAQNQANTLQSRLIAIQHARLQQRIALHLALGGDFE